VEAGKKVVDSPLHLADFGAALTSADSQQMQAVLECQEVWSVMVVGVVYCFVVTRSPSG
jgi:hypothetical protein